MEPSGALLALRRKHGFYPPNVPDGMGKRGTGKRSRELLDEASKQHAEREQGTGEDGVTQPLNLPPQQKTFPRNGPLLDQLAAKFAAFGFGYEVITVKRKGGQDQPNIRYRNYPTVAGQFVTLWDLAAAPLDMFDGYEKVRSGASAWHLHGKPAPAGFTQQLAAMNATGIGYKGLSGVSWLPHVGAFELPAELEGTLHRLASALFLLYDVVAELYRSGEQTVVSTLSHKVPSRILRLCEPGTVDLIRPDIMVAPDGNGGLKLVATELESCPGGHGMTHCMQVGYQMPTDMVDRFVEHLGGRPYRVLFTNEWAEYVFEQGTFVSALRQRGVDARILFDAPLSSVHARVQRDWQPPKAASPAIAARWDTDFLGRLKKAGFGEFVDGCAELPETLPDGTVVFRFGYFDNFGDQKLRRMAAWQQRGVTVVNPLQFFLESKAFMATVKLPAVRAVLKERDAASLDVLDQSLATTHVLRNDGSWREQFGDICADRSFWVTKFAAHDGNNQSWGARSLKVGSQVDQATWADSLTELTDLHHPVVAQHVINGAPFDVPYVNGDGTIHVLGSARTRLTPFFYRTGGQAIHAGSTVTLRAHTYRIHGATDAVEGPVVFGGQGVAR